MKKPGMPMAVSGPASGAPTGAVTATRAAARDRRACRCLSDGRLDGRARAGGGGRGRVFGGACPRAALVFGRRLRRDVRCSLSVGGGWPACSKARAPARQGGPGRRGAGVVVPSVVGVASGGAGVGVGPGWAARASGSAWAWPRAARASGAWAWPRAARASALAWPRAARGSGSALAWPRAAPGVGVGVAAGDTAATGACASATAGSPVGIEPGSQQADGGDAPRRARAWSPAGRRRRVGLPGHRLPARAVVAERGGGGRVAEGAAPYDREERCRQREECHLLASLYELPCWHRFS